MDQALKQIEKLLGHAWPHGGRFSTNPSRPPRPRRETKITLKRKFKQTYLLFGFEAPGLSDPLYPKIKVLDALLGGGMSARLFQEIREKHGLAYEVGSFYPTRVLGSGFVIHMGLQASKAKQAEQCVRDLLKDIATHTPSSEEVKEAKQYIRGTYFMDHQTNSRKAFYAGWWEILGKGGTYDARYPEEIAAVTPDDVRTAAQEIFSKPAQIVELYPKLENACTPFFLIAPSDSPSGGSGRPPVPFYRRYLCGHLNRGRVVPQPHHGHRLGFR